MFDDPLSAVDAHVARHIFSKCFTQFLAGKTRILCTNQLQFLTECDRVIVLHAGSITEQGTYNELMRKDNGELVHLMTSFGTEDSDDEGNGEVQSITVDDAVAKDTITDAVDIELLPHTLQSQPGVAEQQGIAAANDKAISSGEQPVNDTHTGTLVYLKEEVEAVRRLSITDGLPILVRRPSFEGSQEIKIQRQRSRTQSRIQIQAKDLDVRKGNEVGARLVEDETKQVGKVQWQVYRTYFKDGSGGWLIPIILIIVTIITQAFNNVFEYWLSLWTTAFITAYYAGRSAASYYQTVYILLAVGLVIGYFCRGMSFAYQAVLASREFHRRLTKGILSAPMSFFDTTPIGRILNRFSKDMDAIGECLLYLSF
jgi:ATP-binding cassette, subfamily C (CFTR/MRP), member 1